MGRGYSEVSVLYKKSFFSPKANSSLKHLFLNNNLFRAGLSQFQTIALDTVFGRARHPLLDPGGGVLPLPDEAIHLAQVVLTPVCVMATTALLFTPWLLGFHDITWLNLGLNRYNPCNISNKISYINLVLYKQHLRHMNNTIYFTNRFVKVPEIISERLDNLDNL